MQKMFFPKAEGCLLGKLIKYSVIILINPWLLSIISNR